MIRADRLPDVDDRDANTPPAPLLQLMLPTTLQPFLNHNPQKLINLQKVDAIST